MMSLKQIRYFIAIAETGSVSAAASAVYISQSTLTTAIKQLEEELGVSLFERHSKGMELTHSGHQFLRQAYLIMGSVENAKRSLQQTTDDVSGVLNVGVTNMVAGYYLADLVARFKRVYHNISVRVVEDEREYIEHLIIGGELDVAVLMLSDLDNHFAFNTEVLTYSRYHIWLPPEHPLLKEESLNMKSVLEEPQILLSTDEMERRIRAIWEAQRVVPNIAMKSSSVEAVRSFVSAGMGVAVMPEMAYRPWSVEGDRVEAKQILDVSNTLDIGVLWRRGGVRNALINHFIEVARESISPPTFFG
ncbi:LysR family transcriptional regulator [Marinomonas sp. THO17]|uniref:LysR family transcriptional regulator n=1 Tax=Marinomonas sp. THO17 TaxID=3149048 RepID=UPI00336BDA94